MSDSKNDIETHHDPKTRSQSLRKEDIHQSKLKLSCNNLFAFQEENFYFDCLPSEDDHNWNTFTNNQNDTFYIPRNSNLYDSNFFSTYNDKSQVFKLNETTTERQLEDYTVDLEFEKQVNWWTDCDEDDWNDAKLSLNNDISLLSSQSNTWDQQQHNWTTPLKLMRKTPLVGQEDKLNLINKNILSQQSFSSLFDKIASTQNENTLNNNVNSTKTVNNNNKLSFDFLSNSVDLDYNFQNFKNITTTNHYNRNYNTISSNCTTGLNQYNNKLNLNAPPFHLSHHKVLPKNMTNIKTSYLPPYSFKQNHISNPNNSYVSRSTMPVIPLNPYAQMNLYKTANPGNSKSQDLRSWSNYHDIVAMMKEQTGSKFIQKKIEENSQDFLNKLYDKIQSNWHEIITDQFGNYVIQKYVDFCDKAIIAKMLVNLNKNLYSISLNSYGTRPLQKMWMNLKGCYPSEALGIIKSFVQGNVLALIRDINGNHVIQCIIDNLPKEHLTSWYREINVNIVEIAKVKQGGCVFPRWLLNILDAEKEMIIRSVLDKIDILLNDEFGNFILQRIIKLNVEEYNDEIFAFISTEIVRYSSMKFSSNVIESCLNEGCNIKDKIINKIIEKSGNVSVLIVDQFGNYIVQKCLSWLKNTDKERFEFVVEQILKSVKSWNSTNHGRKIYDNLVKKYKEYFSGCYNTSYNVEINNNYNVYCNKGRAKVCRKQK